MENRHGMDRQATNRAIWDFAGFPPTYESMLGESQHPFGYDLMLDLAVRAGLNERSVVLDAACYDASASLPLVQRTGCRLIGVDLSRHGFEVRGKSLDDPNAGRRLSFVQGRLEMLPVATTSCHLVWCRDAISLVDCSVALREMARVLRPGGVLLLHTSCATRLMEPAERRALFADQALHPASMDAGRVERAATRAGLSLQKHVAVGSQWLQHRLEQTPTTADVLSLARLTQWPERYVAAWGETWYRRILGWHQWPIYQALGKLQAHIWVFRRA